MTLGGAREELRYTDFGDPCTPYLAARLLRTGRVAVLPTETLYGFSVPADAEAGLRRLRELKQITRDRPFVGLAADVESVEIHVDTSSCETAMRFLRGVWPAPLTAVLPLRRALAWGERVDSGQTAGFRVPAHTRLRDVLRRVGQVVLSTSVNRSGHPPLLRVEEIQAEFGRESDVWIFGDRRLEDTSRTGGVGSTVADFCVWPPRLLRAGAFDLGRALSARPTI